MQKILYLHAGAEMYGADKVLLELIKGLDKDAFEVHVILPNDGVLVDALEKVGAKVKVIDYPILRRKYFNPKGILEYFGSYNRYFFVHKCSYSFTHTILVFISFYISYLNVVA